MLETAVRSAGVAFACLLVVAIAHKLRVVASRSAREEPLIAAGAWTRRHADATLVAAALLELAIAVPLVFRPAPGYLAFCALLAVYTWRLQSLDTATGCDCFGEFLPARSNSTAIRRNLLLGAIASIAGTSVALGLIEPAALTATVLGLTAIAVAAIAAVQVLDRQLGGNRNLSRI